MGLVYHKIGEMRSYQPPFVGETLPIKHYVTVAVLAEPRLDGVPINNRAEIVGEFYNALFLIVYDTVYNKLIDTFYSAVANIIVLRTRLE